MKHLVWLQGLGVKSEVPCGDLGYWGVDKDNPGMAIKHRGKDKRLTDEARRLLKRRQAKISDRNRLENSESRWA